MPQPHEIELQNWHLLADASLTPRLRDLVARTLNQLAEAYEHRLGVTPPSESQRWLVLFPDRSAYRTFRAQFGAGLPDNTEGHARGSLAATYTKELSRDHLLSLIIHEGTHVLNWATFADRLPQWLEEGLATSLSYNRVNGKGKIVLGTISSTSMSRSQKVGNASGRNATLHQIRLEGPVAALLDYSEKPQGWPPLHSLPSSWQGPTEELRWRYPQAGFLVRYLHDGADRDTQLLFRDLLRELSARDRPELVHALEAQLADIQASFLNWLERTARQSRAHLGPVAGGSR